MERAALHADVSALRATKAAVSRQLKEEQLRARGELLRARNATAAAEKDRQRYAQVAANSIHNQSLS